ncbi:MAG: rubrerythrin family protein [Methanoregula sp.]|jgi:rubrerythrin
MATQENLREAFAGESQASRKYAAFSEKAQEEKYRFVATLFKAASQAEEIHAKKHLTVLGAVESTTKNLEAAISGETHEYSEMYPGFLATAKDEKQNDAMVVFRYAKEAEQVHAELFKKALDAVKAGHDLPEQKIYLCPVCGYISLGKAPDKCPVCSIFAKQFKEITL